MGYLVATTGRLLLPQHLERQALTVAEHRVAGRDGWFDPDTDHVDTLGDLAAVAGVTLTREGDWLTVATDHQGDPKWSDQAEEFYRALGGFVQQGEVHLRGEDGSTWSYSYSPDGLQEHERDAPPVEPSSGAPGEPSAPESSQAPEQPELPELQHPTQSQPQQPSQPPEEPGGIGYPGKQDRPPPRRSAPTPPPGVQDAGWAGVDDDPPPAPPGRVVLMSIVLVVGVALIIGLALLVANI